MKNRLQLKVPVPPILCITLLMYITSIAHICQNILNNISFLYLISYQPVFKNFKKDISESLCVWFLSDFAKLKINNTDVAITELCDVECFKI